MNTKNSIIHSKKGLLTTVAWGLNGKVEYALEGSVFVGGALVQWLRDEMRLIKSAKATEEYANKVEDYIYNKEGLEYAPESNVNKKYDYYTVNLGNELYNCSREQLDNYVKNVIDSGMKVDAVVLDYINLLKGRAGVNSYEKIKEIAEQVRALAVKYGVSVISATQANRETAQTGELDMHNVSESMGLPATADAMFGITQSEEDKELEKGREKLRLL